MENTKFWGLSMHVHITKWVIIDNILNDTEILASIVCPLNTFKMFHMQFASHRKDEMFNHQIQNILLWTNCIMQNTLCIRKENE
jgi:hypothetical protein